MSIQISPPAAPPPSLRAAQRELARKRIRNAAAFLFYERGFSSVTMDDIAKAAMVSRSTLYVHYPDKVDLSVEIAASYADELCALVARLPGPQPSPLQIDEWIGNLDALVTREHVPTTLILELSARGEAPAATTMIEKRLLSALEQRFPTFAHALNDAETHDRARAWAQVVMRELGWACKHAPGESKDARAAKREVAAEIFQRFIQAQIDMGKS